MKRTYRPSLTRNEVVLLLESLEASIEDFKYNGGLCLAEDYIQLHNRLDDWFMKRERPPLPGSEAGV